MKKLNIMLLGALALAFTACDDDTTYGIAQVNPQEPIASANGVTVTLEAPFTGSTIDLTQYQGEMQVLDPAKVVVNEEVAKLPAGKYTMDYELVLADNENMSNQIALPLDAEGKVQGGDVLEAFTTFYGLDPRQMPVWCGVNVFVTYANPVSGLSQRSKLGAADFYYQKKEIKMNQEDAQLEIESEYYLLVNSTNVADAIKLDHSAKHPYNDDLFYTMLDVTTVPTTWVVVPKSVYEAGGTIYECFGPAGTGDATAKEGALTLDGIQGEITAPGNYKFSAWMLTSEDHTPGYKVQLCADYLTVPGPATDWAADATTWRLGTNDYVKYAGLAPIEGEFKLAAGSWDLNWGGAAGTLDLGGSNIQIAPDPNGLYCVNADINELTYSIYEVTEIGLIGAFNDWSESVNLTPNEDKSVWTGEVTFTGADGYLFRFNNDWAHKIGCNNDGTTLLVDGENLTAPGAGTYTVTLDIKSSPMTVSFNTK